MLKGKVTDAADKWAIDGTVLIKEDGSLYFIWSGWAGEENLVQNLYAAAMSDPWTLSSERVLISEPSYDWECQKCPDGPLVNEGPQVLKHDGTIHIVYSASHSLTEDYCLGLLTNKDGDVLNPKSWIKTPYPMFTKNNQAGVYAVGHASFTQSPDDSEHWILYHAMSDVKEGWDSRTTRAQKFMWDADGKPDFGKALSTQTLLKVPSGEV